MSLVVHVHKRLPGFNLRVSLGSPSRGRILCVMGPSGSGKTTLLRLLAGLERPDHGRVRFREAV